MKDLPFGIVYAAQAEFLLGIIFLGGGGILFFNADNLTGTPTLLGAVGSGTLAMIGLALVSIGLLDILAAFFLTRLRALGFGGVMFCCVTSASISAYLLTIGFTMGAMNLFLNIGIPLYLLRWDVRQEYIPR